MKKNTSKLITSLSITFVFAVAFIAMPHTANADSTTTYYIPLPGYTYQVDSYGRPITSGYGNNPYQYTCSNNSCYPVNSGSYGTGYGSGYGNGSNGSYYPTGYQQYYGSQYAYPTYIPTISPSSYNNYNQYPGQSYLGSTILGTGEYVKVPYQSYTPYVKGANGEITLGATKTPPYYGFNADGTINNQYRSNPTTYNSGYGNGGYTMTYAAY